MSPADRALDIWSDTGIAGIRVTKGDDGQHLIFERPDDSTELALFNSVLTVLLSNNDYSRERTLAFLGNGTPNKGIPAEWIIHDERALLDFSREWKKLAPATRQELASQNLERQVGLTTTILMNGERF